MTTMDDATYDRFLDGVKDNAYDQNTEFQMVLRGKHYDETSAVKAVESIIRGLRHQAQSLEDLIKGFTHGGTETAEEKKDD